MGLSGKPVLSAIAVAALAAGMDQIIKWIVENRMDYHQMIDILPFLALFRTHNTGIAFSMLGGLGTGALIAITLLVSVFVVVLWFKTASQDRLARFGLALVLGGAIGNLIDRVMLGYVVDYFLFHTPVWSFAIFNLADAFITAGAGLVLLQEFLRWRAARKLREEEKSSHGD